MMQLQSIYQSIYLTFAAINCCVLSLSLSLSLSLKHYCRVATAEVPEGS